MLCGVAAFSPSLPRQRRCLSTIDTPPLGHLPIFRPYFSLDMAPNDDKHLQLSAACCLRTIRGAAAGIHTLRKQPLVPEPPRTDGRALSGFGPAPPRHCPGGSASTPTPTGRRRYRRCCRCRHLHCRRSCGLQKELPESGPKQRATPGTVQILWRQ